MVDLIGVVLEGFKAVVEWVISLFMAGLRSGYETLTASMFGTPTPVTPNGFIFGEPTNAPWGALYDAVAVGEITVLALFVLVTCVQARHVIRIFNIGSTAEARRTKQTAWAGVFLIITWYWLSVLCLFLVDGFTLVLMPRLETIGHVMLQFLDTSLENPGLALVFATIGGLSMWVLQALYFIREILLYVYIYGMPIAFALAYGNLPVLSRVAMTFSKRFIPLAILPLPAAVVFTGYELLYAQRALTPASAFLRYVVATSLPVLTLYLTWKTFAYATPLTAKAASHTARTAVLVGGVAATAYTAGAGTGMTAARFGPKAAAGQLLAQKSATHNDSEDSDTPSFRRTENDQSP